MGLSEVAVFWGSFVWFLQTVALSQESWLRLLHSQAWWFMLAIYWGLSWGSWLEHLLLMVCLCGWDFEEQESLVEPVSSFLT